MGEYEELRKSAECRYTPGALTGVSYINGEPFVSVNQDSLRQLVSDLDAARAEVSDLAQALADANTARDEARAERDALRAALEGIAHCDHEPGLAGHEMDRLRVVSATARKALAGRGKEGGCGR